jgi:hypothetical protein
MMRTATRFCLLLALAGSFCAIATAQSKPDDKEPRNVDAQNKVVRENRPKLATVSLEQEESVLAFVSTHNPALHGLLGNLKSSRPMVYQKALLDLQRITERLAQVKRNRPHAYDLELKRWQAQSRIQMLSAQLALTPDAETKVKLHEAIQAQAELRLAILKADREAMAMRLKQLDDQIATAESQKDSRVQQEFDRFVAAAGRARPAQGGAPKKRPEAGSVRPAASSKSKE